MSRRQLEPLRPLTADERAWLVRISRAHAAPAAPVARAKALLAVAAGQSYTAAARAAARRSNDAVAHLVRRFNREGLAAVELRHGGGRRVVYTTAQRTRILAEARRTPDPTTDGTGSWSLALLQRALRRAPDGLPGVSTFTIWQVLHEAGLSWQRDRSWCDTGRVLRQRKHGAVVVTDPDAAAKKS
jgi:transposase